MQVNNFEVWLYADPIDAFNDTIPPTLGTNITEGILNVNITTGNDIFEGPQQQIDTGLFTIVTRNPAMDPKINPSLKYNAAIRFIDTNSGEFFRGYVTDVQVEYQRDDNPIITITGTDIFGAMQRVVVSKDTYDAIAALSTGPTWSGIDFYDFTYYMQEFTSKYFGGGYVYPGDRPSPNNDSFWYVGSTNGFYQDSYGNANYAPAKYIPQAGETYLEVLNKYAQTNLMSFSQGPTGYFGAPITDFNAIYVLPFPKYNPNYWSPQSDPLTVYTDYDFSSDAADDKSYQSVLIDNGYNRVINQIDISNESRYIDSGELKSENLNFTRTSDESIEDYAISKVSVDTIYPSDNAVSETLWANRFSQNIFQMVQFPAQEIKQITFDAIKTPTYKWLNEMIRIKHVVNNTETIDNVYDIAGIQHNITPDQWTTTFALKPSAWQFVFQNQGSLPTLELNALTGDSNFNFTATIVDTDPDEITAVLWALSATDENEIQAIWPYASNGNFYKDSVARDGLTQTWNFDDDGILAPYSFDPDSTYTNPLDNRYGGYGAGNWYVYAFIFLSNRFIICLQQELVVGTPVVEADFGWVQNTINNFGQVSFTDTSVNHETDEPDSYLWDFGDGETSTERNPVHVYDPAPDETEYEVSLTVYAYGSGGTKVYDTKTETITLTQPIMVPDFTWTQNQQTITFTNTSTNVGFEEPDAYFWDFGDGTTSTLKNPVKTYGVSEDVSTDFDVTLTIRNIWEETESITQTVTVLAVNNSGTFGVRYIKFRIDPYQKAGTVPSGGDLVVLTPVMSFLKGITSGTGANLTYLKPIYNFNDNYIPRLTWRSTDGNSPQQSLGWQYFLTRDPSITPTTSYGLGAGSQNNLPGVSYANVRWELVVDLGTEIYTINDIILRFEDFFQNGGVYNGIRTESFYPKISIDVANTITNYTPNPSGTYGSPTLNGNWINVGYIKLDGGRMDPTQPAGVRTNAVKTMFKMRPMPLNIPYFTYTFNDKIVSFTSVETADSYLWTFGDGTTSTSKDPVKTYAAYGTYNVTLEVTNGGVVTRTTTEPVKVLTPVI
jgi:PKD repeat protein